MNVLSLLRHPAYLYNPKQVLIRLRRQFKVAGDKNMVRLPWGHPFLINPNEFIGHCIWTQGIFELPVCEAIARLVGAGDTVVDVGANVGFMTSLLSKAVGKTGHVLAFEPHPELYYRLRANVDRFADARSGHVTPESVALADCEGENWLVFDSGLFARNSGEAGLKGTSFTRGEEQVQVRTCRLDQYIDDRVVTLLKLDVEGAELRVLLGAERALAERRIKAIVYEDFDTATSGIASYLKGYGFAVFYLDGGTIVRPRIREVNEGFRQRPRRRDENFLAVLDAAALRQAYRRLGWRVFSL